MAKETMEMLRQEKGVGAYDLSDILLYSDWFGTLLNIRTSLVNLEGDTKVPVYLFSVTYWLSMEILWCIWVL